MRPFAALLLIVAASPLVAQMPMQQPPAEKLVFLPMETVKAQIQEARGLGGVTIPTIEERKRVVAKINGTDVLLGDLLEEVISRFSAQLIPQLLNQQVMDIETTRRKVKITDEEFADSVAIFLAQKKAVQNKQTLREILKDATISWDDFQTLMTANAKIQKLVRKDLGLPVKKQEPLNPLFVQIWAGQKMRGAYQVEMNRSKLPAGVAGRISSTRPISDVLEMLPGSGSSVSVREAKAGAKDDLGRLTISPADGGWPRTTIPLVKIDKAGDGATEQVSVREAIDAAMTRVEQLDRYLCITVEGEDTRIEAPVVQVKKTFMKNVQKPGPNGQAINERNEVTEDAPLAGLVTALANGTVTIGADGEAAPVEGKHPRFVVPDIAVQSNGRQVKLAEALRALTGKKAIALKRVRLNGIYDMIDAPVPLKSMLDRDAVLEFVFGKLSRVHFDEALTSIAGFVSAKQAFAKREITVDEAAVRKIIDDENARYNNPFFNRSTILQALGKTEFEEDRRHWVGNGVDQIIGADASEAELRAYYEKHIRHYGRATVEASHILIDKIDPETGQEDWDSAQRRVDRVAMQLFGGPSPRAVFADVARRLSEDKMTASQGGSLGEFGIRGQMVRDFSAAAFALRPGEVSAPVKTVHGYHFILCTKQTPPDRQKNPFSDPEIQRQVRDDYQQEKRDAWIAAEVTKGIEIERFGEFLPGLKEKP